MRKWMGGGMVAAACLLGGCDTFESRISNLGFDYLQPPRNSVPPGTIVWVKSLNPTVVQIVCSQADALGQHVQTDTSPTLSASWQQTTTATASAQASYKDIVNAQLGGKSVDSISMSLSNASVIEIASDELDRDLTNSKPAPYCVDAVKRALANKEHLTMVTEVLQANVLYTLNYDNSVSASAQAKLTSEVAPSLAASVETTGQNTIQGNGLFWGISDDQNLFNGFLQYADAAPPPPPPPQGGMAVAEVEKIPGVVTDASPKSKPKPAVRLIPVGRVQIIDAPPQ